MLLIDWSYADSGVVAEEHQQRQVVLLWYAFGGTSVWSSAAELTVITVQLLITIIKIS